MVVVDGTVVTVALPYIKVTFGFSNASVVWILNSYELPYAGFLLLSGRLGDMFGHKRLFLTGIAAFTIASLICAAANSASQLIAGRVIQGVSAAVVSTVAQSLVMTMYVETAERAKSVGIYGFACSCGGVVSLLIGGVLTSAFGWRWIFLINAPIGIMVYALGRALLPDVRQIGKGVRSLDLPGAFAVTASLMLAAYAILDGNVAGGNIRRALQLIGGSALLGMLFLAIEARACAPLLPLRILRNRELATCCTVGALFSIAQTGLLFTSLYLQLVLGYTPWQVSLAFVPLNVVSAVFALRFSAYLVVRFGIGPPLIFGLVTAAVGMLLFARAPVHGNIGVDVMPAMLLVGVGIGLVFNPLALATMNGATPDEMGVISGIVNTFWSMGGALGLAILAKVSAIHSDGLLKLGVRPLSALNGGYHYAFAIGAASSLGAAGIAAFLRHRGLTPVCESEAHDS